MMQRRVPDFLKELYAADDAASAAADDLLRRIEEQRQQRGEAARETYNPDERAAAAQQQRLDEWLEARLDEFARDVGREIGVAQKEVLAEIKKAIKHFSKKNIDPTMRATVRTLRTEMRAARFQVKPYRVGERYAAGEVVVHGGGCYQAQRDTAHRPGHGDWICLAAPGERGTDGRDVDRAEIEDLRRRIGELEADIRVRDAAAVIDLPDWRRRGHG